MSPYHHTSDDDLQFKYLRPNRAIQWSDPVNDNRMPRSQKAKRIAAFVIVIGLITWLLMN